MRLAVRATGELRLQLQLPLILCFKVFLPQISHAGGPCTAFAAKARTSEALNLEHYFQIENFFLILQPALTKESIFVSPEWTSRGKHTTWHRAAHNYLPSSLKRYKKATAHTFLLN